MCTMLARLSGCKHQKGSVCVQCGARASLYELLIVLLCLFTGFIGTGIADYQVLGIAFIALGQCAQGMEQVFIKHYINTRLRSKDRATSLSFDGFVTSVLLILVLPTTGWITDHYGVRCAFTILGLFLFLGCGIALILLRSAVFTRIHHQTS